MSFSSPLFLFVFLTIVLAAYYICNKKIKNIFLLLASLAFYSWGSPQYVLLLVLFIFINYGFALLITANKKQIWKKVFLGIVIAIDLGLLVYFKYTGFFIENINSIFNTEIARTSIIWPLGISFYIFQVISYVIDVYRGGIEAEKNIINLGLFVSFFPKITSGPILRYKDIKIQLNDRTFEFARFFSGIERFMLGFIKKVLLADQIAMIADTAFSQANLAAPLAWLGAICYTLQIYFDFSGYTDMAIGIARMFGFEIMENFNYPYISKSIQEFWRRWHISLSLWFRDYLYIPLGGSRKGSFRTYINIFLVFLLTGLWHGASWHYIAWGLYYAVFLIFERAWFSAKLKKMPAVISHLYALFVIVIGWIFFRANGLFAAFSYVGNLFKFPAGSVTQLVSNISIENIVFIVFGVIFSMPLIRLLKEKQNKASTVFYYVVLLILFVVAITYMSGNGFSPFLYEQF